VKWYWWIILGIAAIAIYQRTNNLPGLFNPNPLGAVDPRTVGTYIIGANGQSVLSVSAIKV
jgi:hypothetical protein